MIKYFFEEVSNNISRGNVVMNKLLGILVLFLGLTLLSSCGTTYESLTVIKGIQGQH